MVSLSILVWVVFLEGLDSNWSMSVPGSCTLRDTWCMWGDQMAIGIYDRMQWCSAIRKLKLTPESASCKHYILSNQDYKFKCCCWNFGSFNRQDTGKWMVVFTLCKPFTAFKSKNISPNKLSLHDTTHNSKQLPISWWSLLYNIPLVSIPLWVPMSSFAFILTTCFPVYVYLCIPFSPRLWCPAPHIYLLEFYRSFSADYFMIPSLTSLNIPVRSFLNRS